jgi:energy-coupling factor transporter ATP-binding protein EcfA2
VERGFLHGLRLINFRSARDLKVELKSRFTLLLGANGVGKSTVLDAAHLLSQQLGFPRPTDGKFFIDWARLRRSVTNGESNVRIAATGSEKALWLHMALDEEGGVQQSDVCAGKRYILDQDPTHWEANWFCGPRSNGEDWKALRANLGELTAISSCVRLRLSARAAETPSYPSAEIPRVEHDGSGLPSALAWLATNDDQARRDIENLLREVVPSFQRLRVPKAQVKAGDTVVWGDRLELEFAGRGFVPAEFVSEGTLLSLALLTILRSGQRPKLVLLDDLDKALHPQAQIEVAKRMRGLLALDPELQIVATTHSPFVLDDFDGSDVVILASDEARGTCARLLNEHPEFDSFRESLRPGEFWTTVGERWVLES